MADILIMQGLWWTPVLVVLFALVAMKRVSLHLGWLVAAILAYLAYSIVVLLLAPMAALDEGAFDWGGKLAGIGVSLLMLFAAITWSGARWADAGITLRQRGGALMPALLATAAMVGLMVLLQTIAADGARDSAEALAFQATLPGLDEELFYRGLLLFLLSHAIVSTRRQSDPARFGWAAIFATLLFTAGHAVFVSGGAMRFDPLVFAYVAILGSLLMYIRVRTGSLLVPVLAHNLTNVVGHLI